MKTNLWLFNLAIVTGTLGCISEFLPPTTVYRYIQLELATLTSGLFFLYSSTQKWADRDWKFSAILGMIWSVTSLFHILFLLNHTFK